MVKQALLSFLVLFLLGSLIAGIYYGTRKEQVTISEVTVVGGETVSHDIIDSKIEQVLRGTYFLLIPKRFSFLYPESEIRRIVERVPRVHNVAVVRDSLTALSVTFEEYVPHALWCKSIDASSTESCIFVDWSGYAFAEAPHLRGSALMRYVTEDTEPLVGRQALPPLLLKNADEFAQALAQKHAMRIYGITKTKDGDVIYHIAGGGKLLLTATEDIQTVFDNLDSILTSEEFSHLAPGNFEYIDLRFGSKVYVKKIGSEAETADETVE